MNKVVLGTLAALALTGPVAAADLSVRQPAAAHGTLPSNFSWSGFYLGGYVGGQTGTTTFPRVDGGVTAPDSVSPNGLVGGALMGFNMQFNSMVLGLEAEAGASGVSGSNSGFSGVFAVNNKVEQSWTARVRGRAGLAFGDALLFGAAGASFLDEKLTIQAPGFVPPAANKSGVRNGWNVGGGIEYAFTPNLIGRVEYIYDNYGTKTYDLTAFGYTSRSSRADASTVRVGLTWKFGGDMPAVDPMVVKY